MAEAKECSAETTATTKKIVNPRVEIDTSPPFESVKEAVDRFGGSGPWIPLHLLRLAAAGHHETDGFDVDKIEEQAAQLERDLIAKEQQTLNVLKELESAKRYVEGLKLNLMTEFSPFMESNDKKPGNSMTVPGLMFMELNQAKHNLNKTSLDLAVIQASVESLNEKMRRDKLLLERNTKMMQVPTSEEEQCVSCGQPNLDQKLEMLDGPVPNISMSISKELKQVYNFEADQFKKMTEASRYEVIKAMREIERTKNSIKMAEMRLNAAKKMEEAAKAVEAITVAEKSTFLNNDDGGITLSFEEYRALTQKAYRAEELCKTKFIDTNATNQLEEPIMEKFEQITKENTQSRQVDLSNVEDCYSRNDSTKYKFRNSHGSESCAPKEKPGPGFRSTTSIGDILTRKLVVQDDVMVGGHAENRNTERRHVSLSQMLREQSKLILHSQKQSGEGHVEKQYYMQRKKFGFIHVPLPTKQSKKKTQPLNTR